MKKNQYEAPMIECIATRQSLMKGVLSHVTAGEEGEILDPEEGDSNQELDAKRNSIWNKWDD